MESLLRWQNIGLYAVKNVVDNNNDQPIPYSGTPDYYRDYCRSCFYPAMFRRLKHVVSSWYCSNRLWHYRAYYSNPRYQGKIRDHLQIARNTIH